MKLGGQGILNKLGKGYIHNKMFYKRKMKTKTVMQFRCSRKIKGNSGYNVTNYTLNLYKVTPKYRLIKSKKILVLEHGYKNDKIRKIQSKNSQDKCGFDISEKSFVCRSFIFKACFKTFLGKKLVRLYDTQL